MVIPMKTLTALVLLFTGVAFAGNDPDNGTAALVEQAGKDSIARYNKMAADTAAQNNINAAISAQQATADAINRQTDINNFYNVPYQTTPAARR